MEGSESLHIGYMTAFFDTESADTFFFAISRIPCFEDELVWLFSLRNGKPHLYAKNSERRGKFSYARCFPSISGMVQMIMLLLCKEKNCILEKKKPQPGLGEPAMVPAMKKDWKSLCCS